MTSVQDQSHSIDEVLQSLQQIIRHATQNNHREGYFAMLYYCVTARVKEGILQQEFEDGPRMERLDVLFANRYLQAWQQRQRGEQPTLSWQVAFDHSAAESGIVLQHLLLGINAHINLDLGIATAQTMEGQNIHRIKNDFDRINAILRAMTGKVQDNLNTVSPLMGVLDWYGKTSDEMLADFSIQIARDGAWQFALALSQKTGDDYSRCVLQRDQQIAALARLMAKPTGRLFRILLRIVQFFERKTPAQVIPMLKVE